MTGDVEFENQNGKSSVQMKLAQFYRFFCRYTVVLAQATDTELIAAVEARKMIICVRLEEAQEFLRKQLSRA